MKKIVVLGGGISGYGSAILAKKKGFDVFLSDKGRIADRYKAKLDSGRSPTRRGTTPKSGSSRRTRSSSRPAFRTRRR